MYADAIVRALNEARVFVLVLSAHACASPHVGREIERACAKRRPLITLRADSQPLTPAFEYYLSESQWIDIGSGLRGATAATLVDAVRRHLILAHAAGPILNQGAAAPAVPIKVFGNYVQPLAGARKAPGGDRLDRGAAFRGHRRSRKHEILWRRNRRSLIQALSEVFDLEVMPVLMGQSAAYEAARRPGD
jgi:hypothetical protein